jgi:hypothetical protein
MISFRLLTGPALALAIPLFCQSAGAAIVFTETFEGNTNTFGLPTYNYTANYTLANSLASPGAKYAHGGNPAGGGEVAFQQSFSGPVLSLTTLGYSNATVDSGTLSLNLTAQFSTYQSQNDYALVTVRFLDALGVDLGAAVSIGSSAFVTQLPGGGGSRGWGETSLSGAIPVGTRSLSLGLTEVKTPQGAYTDGYVDNVSVAVVPEPGTWLLCVAGAAAGLIRRQRP